MSEGSVGGASRGSNQPMQGPVEGPEGTHIDVEMGTKKAKPKVKEGSEVVVSQAIQLSKRALETNSKTVKGKGASLELREALSHILQLEEAEGLEVEDFEVRLSRLVEKASTFSTEDQQKIMEVAKERWEESLEEKKGWFSWVSERLPFHQTRMALYERGMSLLSKENLEVAIFVRNIALWSGAKAVDEVAKHPVVTPVVGGMDKVIRVGGAIAGNAVSEIAGWVTEIMVSTAPDMFTAEEGKEAGDTVRARINKVNTGIAEMYLSDRKLEDLTAYMDGKVAQYYGFAAQDINAMIIGLNRPVLGTALQAKESDMLYKVLEMAIFTALMAQFGPGGAQGTLLVMQPMKLLSSQAYLFCGTATFCIMETIKKGKLPVKDAIVKAFREVPMGLGRTAIKMVSKSLFGSSTTMVSSVSNYLLRKMMLKEMVLPTVKFLKEGAQSFLEELGVENIFLKKAPSFEEIMAFITVESPGKWSDLSADELKKFDEGLEKLSQEEISQLREVTTEEMLDEMPEELRGRLFE